MTLKVLFVASILALSLPINLHGKSDQQSKIEQELRALIHTWDQAFVKGDTATLDRLLAEEFAFVGGAQKADYLASFKTRAADSVQSAVSTDIQVQVYGDTAIVVGVDAISGLNKGQPYSTKYLYMDVWIKRDRRWQCVKTYASAAK